MGILLGFGAALFASSKDLLSKRLSLSITSKLSTFASFACALPFYLLLLLILYLLGLEDFHFGVTFLVLVVCRAVTDLFAEGFKMHALAHGDLSIVAIFISLPPLFVLVTSPLITGDHISAGGVFAVLLIVAGTMVSVITPQALHGDFAGNGKAIAFGILSSIFFSLNVCFDRLAVQHSSPTMAGFCMTLLAAVFIYPFVRGAPVLALQTRETAWAIWTRGFFEVGFMVLKLWALQFLAAPYVSGITKISLLLSILGGRVFFGEQATGKRLFAAVFIVAGIVLIAFVGE